MVLLSFLFISKIIKTGKPESIANDIKLPLRTGAQVFLRQWPKSNFVKTNYYLFNLLNVWNRMPLEVKLLDVRKLKKRARSVLIKCPDPLAFRKSKQ